MWLLYGRMRLRGKRRNNRIYREYPINKRTLVPKHFSFELYICYQKNIIFETYPII